MRLTLLALPLLLSAATLAQADVVAMPADGGTMEMVSKPQKGSTMKSVQQQFGAPEKKHPPVGGGSRQQPPITRWDYAGFSVFFEHGHVIDAVVPGRPPALQRTEELQSSQR